MLSILSVAFTRVFLISVLSVDRLTVTDIRTGLKGTYYAKSTFTLSLDINVCW